MCIRVHSWFAKQERTAGAIFTALQSDVHSRFICQLPDPFDPKLIEYRIGRHELHVFQ